MVLPHIAFARFFTRLFDFGGRSSRSEFWWGQLLVPVALFFAVVPLSQIAPTEATGGIPVAGFIVLGVLMAWIAGQLSAQVRRLHDTGKSGVWLLMALVPLVGSFIMLFLLVQPSDDGNKWGPPPGEPMRPLREPDAPELGNADAQVV